MSTRKLVLLLTILAVPLGTVSALSTCKAQSKPAHERLIIIGVDGFDPRLASQMMDAGELPNLSKMRDSQGFQPLETSMPPQSPVAWANFITGADPGVHGIFDFIHRHPERQYSPYYSAAETIESDDGWDVGEHKLPLTFFPFNHNPTQTLLRREGTPWWDYLDEAGVPVYIYDIPSNYPPSPSRFGHVCCLCGMGVPDLLGTYGTNQTFSVRNRKESSQDGALRKPLRFKKHTATAAITGPVNSLLKKPQDSQVEFTIHRHPIQPLARLELPNQTLVLKAGEWSDWVQLDFELEMPAFLPNETVSGICRFFLQEVRPTFRLYVTPINIDPTNLGEQQISEPKEFVTEIANELGLFYTTGFQEDHKALSNKIFTDEEYLEQATHVLDERLTLLDYAMDRFDDGVLFFYFSSTDLQAHMFWWASDAKHPVREPEQARKFNGVIEDLYRQIDGVVGRVQSRYPDTTVMVMSDHGFANFRRQFNLNTWLRDNGYIWPPDCDSLLASPTGRNVDWSQTRAYGLGLNGLYLNLAGRERDGIVSPQERDALLAEISAKLLEVRDPETGEQVITRVYRADEIYHGPMVEKAPDLLVGYKRGYRCSWATTLGTITDEVLSDNDSAWSADHCMAYEEVPGVIFSSRPILRSDPALVDLAPTILEYYDLQPPPSMIGGSLFKTRPVAAAASRKE